MTFQVFLPRDAMHKHSMWLCGVCPSVCLSVTFVDFVKANKHIFNFFIVFPYTKRYGNILTPPPLTRALNTGGVGKSRDSQPISGFIACCERFDCQVTKQMQRTVASWWHLSLVSGDVCFSQKTTRNVYDKKPERYAEDNRAAMINLQPN